VTRLLGDRSDCARGAASALATRAIRSCAVRAGGSRKASSRSALRDALCSMIGTTVVEAREHGSDRDHDFRIELRTDAGHVLTVPLDHGSRVGPEAAHLIPADSTGRLDSSDMWVW
jgi:hypothetical protein